MEKGGIEEGSKGELQLTYDNGEDGEDYTSNDDLHSTLLPPHLLCQEPGTSSEMSGALSQIL